MMGRPIFSGVSSAGSKEQADTKELIQQYEKEIYDLKQLLDISSTLCSSLDLSALMESILYVFMCQMHVLGAGIFILNALEADAFELGTNYTGLEPDRDIVYTIPADSPLIRILTKENTVFTLDDLKEQMPPAGNLSVLSTLEPSLVVPLLLKNHLNGILLLGERIDLGESREYSQYEKDQILKLALFAAVAINNAALVERSSTDMMTHLKHKYFFFDRLSDELDLAVAQNLPLAVIMFDVDFFKSVNDNYGHAFGDYVLTSIAGIIMANIRGKDLASRYGGEEFTVMLYNTGKENAMQVAERIRRKAETYDFHFEGRHVHITISGGIAVFSKKGNPTASSRELVDQADQGLYMAKHNGRNRIVYAHPDLVSKWKEL